eukprot:scaffold156107_cov33-Tisochrysis_lutea.AAC.1
MPPCSAGVDARHIRVSATSGLKLLLRAPGIRQVRGPWRRGAAEPPMRKLWAPTSVGAMCGGRACQEGGWFLPHSRGGVERGVSSCPPRPPRAN